MTSFTWAPRSCCRHKAGQHQPISGVSDKTTIVRSWYFQLRPFSSLVADFRVRGVLSAYWLVNPVSGVCDSIGLWSSQWRAIHHPTLREWTRYNWVFMPKFARIDFNKTTVTSCTSNSAKNVAKFFTMQLFGRKWYQTLWNEPHVYGPEVIE